MIRRTRTRRGGRRRRTQKGGNMWRHVSAMFGFGKPSERRGCNGEKCPNGDLPPAKAAEPAAEPAGFAAKPAPVGGKSRRKGRKSRRRGTRKGMRRKTARKAYKGLRRRRH